MTPRKNRFLWGTSTSAYQVEGGITNNDWDFFTRSDSIKRRIASLTKPSLLYKDSTQVQLQPAGDAAKAWEPRYYQNDFELAKKIGANAFRIGVEWARIEPEKDQWDQGAIDHYKQMLRSMTDAGLTPVVTLNHLTLPLWVLTPPSKFTKRIGQGLLPSPLRDLPLADPPASDQYWKSLRGWENKETVKEFIRYVAKVVKELRDQVDYWVTIGEPVASVIGLGYIAGLWPPGFLLDGSRAKNVLHNLIEAHVQAYDKISSLDNIDVDGDGISKMVGFSHAMIAVSPAKPSKLLGTTTINNNQEAAKNFDYFINDYFINAVVNGEEDLNYLDTLQRYNKGSGNFIVHERWKNKTDFIGIDYYRRAYVKYSNILAMSSAKFVGGSLINNLHSQTHNQPHGILNSLGWEIYPDGLYKIIMHITKEWNSVPIFITENGVADKSDKYRAQFIISHLKQIRLALDKGANVIGYLHWSFMDNYEWLDNYKPEARFGLFYIDRSDPKLPRLITRGAEAYKFIIQESCHENIDGTIAHPALLKAENRFGIFSPDGSSLYGQSN